MSEPITIERFTEVVKDAATSMPTLFEEPDDDWAPVAMILGYKEGQEGLGVGVAPIPPAWLEDKDELVKLLRKAIKEYRAVAIGLVLSAWMLRLEKDEVEHPELDLPRPSESEDREEILTVSILAANEEHFLMAEIKRDNENPPTLGEWETSDDSSGRFVEPLVDALKTVEREANE